MIIWNSKNEYVGDLIKFSMDGNFENGQSGGDQCCLVINLKLEDFSD